VEMGGATEDRWPYCQEGCGGAVVRVSISMWRCSKDWDSEQSTDRW
jgi:hypothetical protein